VFRIDGLSLQQVADLGATHLRDPRPFGHLRSRAEVILNIGLQLAPDNFPERHASIVGWPERKEEQKLLAIKLAAAATVVRHP
jgi:hypothetical protein